MSFEIYHQGGHNSRWNIDSIESDRTGEGIILSAKDMQPANIHLLNAQIRASAIFDPQFFIPGTARNKLSKYTFFPENIANGFDTNVYPDQVASESATRCVSFQSSFNFRYITIPTRYMPGMPSDFHDAQHELFIDPFLTAIDEQIPDSKPVALQLILNSHMIKDNEYSKYLLNWITGIPRIDAVYLVIEVLQRRKQVQDIDFITSFLKFVDVLSESGLDVILGYLNTESLIYSLANPAIVTMGSYETTRIFNIENFEESERTGGGGPNARIYTANLLQNVDSNYSGAIMDTLQCDHDFFGVNKYHATMFERTFQWHFSKPELYKHQFLELSAQLRELANLENKDRFKRLHNMIESSHAIYAQLQEEGVVLDSESSGNHLAPWLTAINRFAKYKGWNS